MADNEIVFKAETFWGAIEECRVNGYGSDKIADVVARMAQHLFDLWLKDAPTMYGRDYGTVWSKKDITQNNYTHKAKLVCIEKLEPIDEQVSLRGKRVEP